jgi:hypothetical protein
VGTALRQSRALLAEALKETSKCVNPSIPEKRPVPADFFEEGGVHLGVEDDFLIGGGFGKDRPEWIGYEGLSPEL